MMSCNNAKSKTPSQVACNFHFIKAFLFFAPLLIIVLAGCSSFDAAQACSCG